MFSKYFDKIEKDLTKKVKSLKKGEGKKETAGKSGSKIKKTDTMDIGALKDILNKIVPSQYVIDSVKMIDPSGYSPDEVDLIAYKQLYRDIVGIMNGHVPCELVYGTFHVYPVLNKNSFNDLIRTIVQVKKINRFTDREDKPALIPAFVIAYDTDIGLADLKTVLIDNYMSMSIDPASEIDIIAIINKGLVIKNWRDKRSYIALETGKDTFMWFFILMNEYLDVNKDNEFDLRNYVKHGEKYNEY
ncbi:MAG: hypothetical protein JXN64_03215 [Spirochaetes bacterium]|nr:hypothetical protein [Spirochaetota bacterium]